MSIIGEPTSLSAALHDAALSVEPPPTEVLYGEAVRRGRRIKRNRALGTGLAGAVVLAAGGALITTAHYGAHTTATASVLSGPVNRDYMIAAYEAALPSNAKITGAVTAEGYHAGDSKSWSTQATANVLVSGRQYTVYVDIQRGEDKWPACTAVLRCSTATVDGASPETIEIYAWLPGDDATISVSVSSRGHLAGSAAQPFSIGQIEQMLTANVWTKVLDDLPK
ncbi:hypothetical protein KDK95_06030 [Actinospica sp. MGRD01-02]|uniref:Uncharacterized protein n=1 Tax=Actinospica acidithermotolerans TaxID=2828514 RepID=A0A941E453_9ACTN|nr:hypothetical protein [Actinospica acidithermotolerans]MBR7825860.1 hypothetical protein [Actinospica acidithermotolerans]